MRTFAGRLRNPVAGHPRDQIMGRSRDVLKMSIIHFFLNLAQQHIELTLAAYTRLHSEL